MLTLHHYPISAPSRFIRLIFGEYRVAFRMIEEKPWQRRPEFLRTNPAGSVPVLVENDGPPVCGAYAIAEYLDETRGFGAGEGRLMPDHPHHRAEARRLVEWFIGKMETEATSYLVHEKIIKREAQRGAPDSAVMRAARANLREHLKYAGYLASERKWLSGDRLTYADLAAAAALSCVDYLGEVPWDADDQAKDWYARMKSRPSFRPLLQDRLAGMPPPLAYADLDF